MPLDRRLTAAQEHEAQLQAVLDQEAAAQDAVASGDAVLHAAEARLGQLKKECNDLVGDLQPEIDGLNFEIERLKAELQQLGVAEAGGCAVSLALLPVFARVSVSMFFDMHQLLHGNFLRLLTHSVMHVR